MQPSVQRAASLWDRFWFADIPPHVYALLRILVATIAIAGLIGVRHVDVFWDPSGFVPSTGLAGLKLVLAERGMALTGGRVLLIGSFLCYAMMAVGLVSTVSVPLSLGAAVLQAHWNPLPLSGEHMVLRAVLFCLVWADCGSVWSVDAWIAHRRNREEHRTLPSSITALRLLRFQIAVIYLSSGLWKLFDEHWRNGTALHYVLYNNAFRRFPLQVPQTADAFTTILTYAVIAWELSFAPLVLFSRTRRFALLSGVVLHLGMTLVLEVGLFPWIMLASYTSFLDPERIPALVNRSRRITRAS